MKVYSKKSSTATKQPATAKIGSADFDGTADISLWTKVAEFTSVGTTWNIPLANYEYVNVVLQNSVGTICSSTLAKISDFINNYVLSSFYFIAGEKIYNGGGGIKIDTSKVITLTTVYKWTIYSFGKIIVYAM